MDILKPSTEGMGQTVCNAPDIEMMWDSEVNEEELVMDLERVEREEEVQTCEMTEAAGNNSGGVECDSTMLEEARRLAVRKLATEKGFWKCPIQAEGQKIYLYVDLE